MSLAIITAADGAPWEAELVGRLAAAPDGLKVARRCVDVVELAAVAASGQGEVAFVDAQLRRLDRELVERISESGVAVVGVIATVMEADVERLRAVGVGYAIPAEAALEVYLDVARTALAALRGQTPGIAGRSYGDPAARSGLSGPAREAVPVEPSMTRSPGSIIAVWGPTGAPGRTTVAVNLADEIGRSGASCLLIDADVYGGVVSNALGLRDEAPGIVAACRQFEGGRLTRPGLAGLCWQFRPNLRVLTGPSRADRWPELRPRAVEGVLGLARQLAEFVVVDLAFCLEADEELSYDVAAPRRNGATLAILDAADEILAVGAADPLGLQRLVRGLEELRSAGVDPAPRVVLNKVRAEVLTGRRAEPELSAALARFAGHEPFAFLPYEPDALDQALRLGRTLGEAAAGSAVRAALVRLASALTGRSAPSAGQRRRARLARHG